MESVFVVGADYSGGMRAESFPRSLGRQSTREEGEEVEYTVGARMRLQALGEVSAENSSESQKKHCQHSQDCLYA